MLQNLVLRVNMFMETSFKGLVNLCISKQQEAQLTEVAAHIDSVLQNTNYAVQRLSEDNQNQVMDECQRIQEIHQSCLDNLSQSFKEIIGRIYSVESETFKSHKFKDTLSTLETLMHESHRLNLYQLLPKLIDSLKLRQV
jgi:hypothetical protein